MVATVLVFPVRAVYLFPVGVNIKEIATVIVPSQVKSRWLLLTQDLCGRQQRRKAGSQGSANLRVS